MLVTSSKSWLHKWKGFDDISATTLTCWNRSGSVNGSSCRWQSCYVCLEGERCPRSHQLIHVKLQVLMELQFFPTCTWTQRLQINSIHSPIFSRVFRYFLAVHLTAGTTLFSLHSMVNRPCRTTSSHSQCGSFQRSGWSAGWGVSNFSRFRSCLFFYEVLFIGVITLRWAH